MTIIEKIKQSVEGATVMPFLYHAAGELNELLARCDSLPVAYSFLIDSGTIDDVNGRYHERVTIAVMFCDKTEFDFNAIENEEIIDRMKVKAYKWLQSLRMSNALRIVSVNNTQRLYDNTTDILTGFAVNITIEDIAGVGECELPEMVIDVDRNGSYNVVGVDKVRVNVVPKLDELEVTMNGEYLPPTDIAGFRKVSVDVQPVLEEMIITENGTYTPREGVDGFSKVTAEFDTSSLPKVKVFTIKITDDCFNDNGIWEGETLIDMSEVEVLSGFCIGIKKKKYINGSSWKVSNKATNFNGIFGQCNLVTANLTNWDTSKVINMFRAFQYNDNLEVLDISGWSAKSVADYSIQNFVFGCRKLRTFVGDKDIDYIINNDIKVLDGLTAHGMSLSGTILDRASLRAVINGLADLTGQTAKTLTLGATLMAKLTEEDIAIATNKNWTIA